MISAAVFHHRRQQRPVTQHRRRRRRRHEIATISDRRREVEVDADAGVRDLVRRRRAATATKSADVAAPEVGTHPKVDERIVATVAHGEPVGSYPDDLDVFELPDVGQRVADERDDVQWQPAQSVDDDDRNHHLHHLRKQRQGFPSSSS